MKRNDEENAETMATINGIDFGDFTIITPFKNFSVSKAALFRSQYFKNNIVGKNTWVFNITENELLYLRLVLLLLHDQSDEEIIKKFTNDDFFKFYHSIKTQFECDEQIIKDFINLFFKVKNIDFSKDITEDKLQFLKPSKDLIHLTKDPTYNAYTFELFKIFLKETYKDIRVCDQKKNDFIELPYKAILFILRNDDFLTDSENSVFYLLMMWFDAQKIPLTDQELDPLFKSLKWNDLSTLFFENIVGVALERRSDMRRPSLQYYSEQYACRANRKKELHMDHRKRIKLDEKIIEISCHFGFDMEKLKNNESIYCAGILINGYIFSSFINMKKNYPNEVDCLKCFLKCISCTDRKEITTPLNSFSGANGVAVKYDHQLPINVRFKIIKRDNTEKVFGTMPLVFKNFCEASGGNLTTPEEMQQLFNHGPQSPCILLREGSNQLPELFIVISIEFLSSDQNLPGGLQVLHTEPFIPLI